MLNWLEAHAPLLHWLARGAGLRKQTFEIEPGSSFSRRRSRSPPPPSPKTSPQRTSRRRPPTTRSRRSRRRRSQRKKEKLAVVLIQGFAANGIFSWQFQFGVLVGQYDVYIPDLFFFGGSATAALDRSPAFQAQCVAAVLDRLGVKRCTTVGFSYGGMVAFKMAELRPDLVRSLVITGSAFAMTMPVTRAILDELGFTSLSEMLLPESVERVKALLSIAMYKKLWFPSCFCRAYPEVMFSNRKQRAELLEGLVISNKDAKVPSLDPRILLLWGENDKIFKPELAKIMKEQLGEKTELESIKKAGHLLHIERSCVFNRHLKRFLALINER